MVSKLVLENLVKGESKTVIGWNMNSTVNQVVLIVSLVSSVHIIIGSIGLCGLQLFRIGPPQDTADISSLATSQTV